MVATPVASSDWIVELVKRYRSGDEEAAAELISRFERYLQKWNRLLLTGRWDGRDGEIRSFLHTLGSMDVNLTAQVISKRLKAYERADIEQETRVALLETAIRYGNVVGYFRYVLRKRLGELTRDPLVFGFPQRGELKEIPEEPEAHPDIDESWVEGDTCGPGFDELSPRERKVLQLHYWFGFTEEKVAEILGVSRSTVSRTLRRARLILKVHYLD